MAANYNQFKQAWDMMDENQRKQQTELYKDNQQFQQFAQQYSNEKNNSNNTGTVNNTTGANNNSNSNNGNGSNGHYDPIYYRNEENNSNSSSSSNNSSSDRSYYENNGYSSDGKNGDGGFYGKTNFDKEETLDKSMFNEAPGKITIEAGTGKDTGRPDYEVWDAARETEMKKNLDEYYATMPHLFRDRDTFNKFFEYNKRESDAQRELLDSYWKKAQNDKAANTYTNSDQLKLGFSNGDVTPDILDAIKYNNPDLYAQWEKAMQDDLNARIANYAVPRTATDTADIWMDLVKKLGLEAGDPYQIYDNWVGRCEELGVFNMNNQLSSYISEMEQVKGERTAAMQRVMTQGAGRKSQALIDAQVAKTSSLYDARFADLQNMYQATYNQRQQNLAIANQSAQMLQAQAAEDQRIFNNKITALGFAMKVDDYRTPEQQLQNQLRFNAINNDLQLLNKAKSNDLELYNKYATAKLENQLNYEMQDLTVTDPKQLRANLKNVLEPRYEKYGNIIERSKSQVIEDVIALAKKKGISVAEALRENFTKELMAKQEYKDMMNKELGINPYESLKYGPQYEVTVDENGKKTWKLTGYGTDIPGINGFSSRDELQGTLSTVYNSIGNPETFTQAISQIYPEGTTGFGQCGEFVNDVLKAMGDKTRVGSTLDSKKAIINKDAGVSPRAGYVAIMNSSKYPDNGHCAIVLGDNGDGTIRVMESNWGDDEAVHYRNVDKSAIIGYYGSDVVDNANPNDSIFEKAYGDAGAKDERKAVTVAQGMYRVLSGMKDEDSTGKSLIDYLATDSYAKDYLTEFFAGLATDEEDNGTNLIDATEKILKERSFKEGVPEQSQQAILKVMDLIEQKLRQESGAAINSSEWASHFMRFLPQKGDTLNTAYSKLSRFDDFIVNSLPPKYTKEYFQNPLFSNTYIYNKTHTNGVADTPELPSKISNVVLPGNVKVTVNDSSIDFESIIKNHRSGK